MTFRTPQKISAFSQILFFGFWLVILIWGKHPDAPWGDGIGYALAIEKGWDWATNANSHWLYLNFHHAVLICLPWFDGLQILGWASVFWAMLSLVFSFRLVHKIGGKNAAFFATQILALSFPFWRLASIPEVYTMELFFWIILLDYLMVFLKEPKIKNASQLTLVHSLGLLVHVHFVLVFPLLLFLILRKGKPFWVSLAPYCIVLALVYWSTQILKTNSISQVFFDSVQDKMLTFDLQVLWKGPVFGLCMVMASLPLISWPGLFHWCLNLKDSRLGIMTWLGMGLPLFGFTCLFPEPGIMVFLLPLILLVSIETGLKWTSIPYRKFPVFNAFPTWFLLGFGLQLVVYFSAEKILIEVASPKFAEAQEIKGGLGFVTKPWARNNLISLPELVEKTPVSSLPLGLKWNWEQALEWNRRQSGKVHKVPVKP
jgi:hypothetical protein